ncbi:bleomycin resistance family protein [Geomicrobium sp. JCM 19037]|uniref:bleomycin resistance family protein n=1 Tax=Geomicrobium sp. JCM 19037 TaxID=1460634 RepID=UPI0005AB01AD|nr:bleomycin resistance family protein [Geomicrobium sp. JCM 19037]
MKMIHAIPKLPVHNITSSITFYEYQLGFTLIYSDEEYAILTYDKVELHIFKWFTTDSVSQLIAQSCRIRVKDVAKFYDDYKEKNIIHPNGHLITQPWGETDFTVVDINNNAISFYE